MGRPLRLLLIEDSAADAELVALQLRRARYEITTDRVDNAEDLSAAKKPAPGISSCWTTVCPGSVPPRHSR